MLSPKRTKYRKYHRGRMRGKATRGNEICFGSFGLQASNQLGLPHVKLKHLDEQLHVIQNVEQNYGFGSSQIKLLLHELQNQEWDLVKVL